MTTARKSVDEILRIRRQNHLRWVAANPPERCNDCYHADTGLCADHRALQNGDQGDLFGDHR